jgi:hypothetical protein
VLEVGGDGVVAQLGHEVGLPVVLQAGRDQSVEGGVQRRVRHGPDVLGHHRGHVVQRLEGGLALVQWARPAGHEGQEGLAVPVLGDERQRRGDLPGREPAELLGGVGDELAVEAQHGLGVVQLEEHGAAVDVLDRMQLELQRGDHAEVAAAPAQRPEQVLVLLLAGHQEAAVGGHHVGRDQVVAGQPEPAGQVADAAAQGEPAHAGCRDDATGRGQAERVGCGVEVTPGGAALGPRPLARRVDPDAAHAREVDDHAVVDRAEPRDAVGAAADGQIEVVLTGEVDRRDDVARVRRPDHGSRPAVDHRVVDLAGVLVARVVRGEHLTSQLLTQVRHRYAAHVSSSPRCRLCSPRAVVVARS